jgi:hypothetical protein
MERQGLKRRKEDDKRNSMIWSSAKATVAFIFFGILSFLGSWGINMNSSLAKLKEDVAIIHERQEFLGPWLVDNVKEIRSELKALRTDVEIISREQARRTIAIQKIMKEKNP